MALFRDIPTFTRNAGYMVNVGLDYLPDQYIRFVVQYGLDVAPDFQRGHVWTQDQKIRFIEYMLRGGTSGLDIFINCPNWNEGDIGPNVPNGWCVLVDGKQRLDAALGFLNNEFPAFGHYFREYEDKPRLTRANFRWHVNDLKTREECLQWYLDLNSGGTVHSEEELDRVRSLLRDNTPYVQPPVEQLKANANIDRKVIQDQLRKIEAEKVAAAAEREARAAAEAAKPKKGRGKKR